jgi:GNAT superfamily N-acetyltransferase
MLRGTYSPENTVKTIAGWIHDPDCATFIHDNAVLSVVRRPCYTVEPEAMVEMFYVAPDARGSGLARQMVAELDAWCKTSGVINCYAISQSSFNDGGKNAMLFTNLFKKAGFETIGDSLVKGY